MRRSEVLRKLVPRIDDVLQRQSNARKVFIVMDSVG